MLTFHLKAKSEVERQSWVTQLELAKSKAITMIESGEFRRRSFDELIVTVLSSPVVAR